MPLSPAPGAATHVTTPAAADARVEALRRWLRGLPPHLAVDSDSLTPASTDASTRRYFRVVSGTANRREGAKDRGSAERGETRIAVDAPPPEKNREFVHIAGRRCCINLAVAVAVAGDAQRS